MLNLLNKIYVIKAVRESAGLGLYDAKVAVEKMMEVAEVDGTNGHVCKQAAVHTITDFDLDLYYRTRRAAEEAKAASDRAYARYTAAMRLYEKCTDQVYVCREAIQGQRPIPVDENDLPRVN